MELFLREGKRVKLTEEGRKFLLHAKRVMRAYEEGLEDLNAYTQGYSTKFSIAISPLIADTILPYVLKTYLDQHPEVEIEVKILESVKIEEAVWKEEVDIGLSCLPSHHEQLVSELLYKDRVMMDATRKALRRMMKTHNHPGFSQYCHQKDVSERSNDEGVTSAYHETVYR